MNSKLKAHLKRYGLTYALVAATTVLVGLQLRTDSRLQQLGQYAKRLDSDIDQVIANPWFIQQTGDNQFKVRRFILHPTDPTHPQPEGSLLALGE